MMVPSLPPTTVVKQSDTFLSLPNEIFDAVAFLLSNRDIKQLRLVCRCLRDKAHLRLSRVFISASPRNIKVLYNIANHETFRKRVTEIIWDDATFLEEWLPDEYLEENYGWDEEHECPAWFVEAVELELNVLRDRKGCDTDRPDHIARQKQIDANLPLSECWKFYQKLIEEQKEVLVSESDVLAFRYALKRFPSLKRVSITPTTHGFLFTPLYETPMIRGFPYGFKYPIPYGWLCIAEWGWDSSEWGWESRAPLWADDDERVQEDIRRQWRGFQIVVKTLAQAEVRHHVSELVLAVHELNTGLNCHIFDRVCEEYNDFAALVRRPNFRRLDLSLHVGGLKDQDWVSYRSGLLRKALEGAQDLEHFELHTNLDTSIDAETTNTDGRHLNEVPLRTILPIETWPRLQHFGLSGFLVDQNDLLSLLSELPMTVRSVKLSFLKFLGKKGNYRSLLYEICNILDWRHRVPGERPKITIGIHLSGGQSGRALWVSKEAEAFIYGKGRNPFGLEDGRDPNMVFQGVGTERDEFEPAHERPHVSLEELERLGIVHVEEWSDW